MDFGDLFIALVVVTVGIISFFGFLNFGNSLYGSELASNLNSTASRVENSLTNNITSISTATSRGIANEVGPDQGTQDENFLRRAQTAINSFGDLIGLVPSLFGEVGTEVLKVDSRIVDIARYAFIFLFALSLAILFILGIRSRFAVS